ncbi:hypothetical protein GCM10027047_27130 [Rhodococcus aerolatus]
MHNGPAHEPGLALPGGGLGLLGLRERAEGLGGTLEAGPVEHGGHRLQVSLPVRPGG